MYPVLAQRLVSSHSSLINGGELNERLHYWIVAEAKTQFKGHRKPDMIICLRHSPHIAVQAFDSFGIFEFQSHFLKDIY